MCGLRLRWVNFAHQPCHEGTPLEAYRQRARNFSRAGLTGFTKSPFVRGLAPEELLQAQHSMTIQCPMCERCPGLQLEPTLQQSVLGTICTWLGKKALKKQRPSCTLSFSWTQGPGASSESADRILSC